MEGWIDVRNLAGTKVGSGPITTARAWQQSKRVDEAGTFSFEMPASDARWLDIGDNFTCEYYGLVNGAVTLLGAGIAEQVGQAPGDPSMVNISGRDLLSELARYPVGELQIIEQNWGYLSGNKGAVKQLNPHWYYDIDPVTGSHYKTNIYDAAIDLPEARDENVGTATGTVSVSGTHDYITETQHYLMIGSDKSISKIRLTLGSVNGSQVATGKLQYPNSTGWVDISFTDGTVIDGRPMAKSGDLVFTEPADIVRIEAAGGAGNQHWFRYSLFGNNTEVSFTIKEIEVYGAQPTKTGVALITGIANSYNANWSVVNTATTNEAYLQFHGESVLAALIALAQATGDHFILGSGRTLTWLGAGSTWSASGYRAVQAQEPSTGTVLINNLNVVKDTAELLTRIIPLAGNGTQSIDLTLTSRTAPAGYTLVKNPTAPRQPYLENDAAEAAYGIIAKVVDFNDLECMQLSSWYEHPENAANQLFDAAKVYLDQHCIPAYQYELEVTGLKELQQPGKTINVVYQEWTDGVKTIDIDTFPSSPLMIMGVTHIHNDSGHLTAALEVSNIDRRAESGDSSIVGAIRTVRGLARSGQPSAVSTQVVQSISSSDVDINGGTIDGTPIGSETPAAVNAAALTFQTIGSHTHAGTGSGGLVSHTELAAIGANDHHTAFTPTDHTNIGNSAPHHAPVTEGTGIDVSGQQVGLDLAANLTWTGDQVFQGANTYRNLLPETTETYDIGAIGKYWRNQWVSQIYATIFAESTAQLIGGEFIIPKGTGVLPATASGDSAIDFGKAMTPNDHLLIKSQTSAGAYATEYIKVGTLVSGTTYNVTRDEAGAHATDPAWPSGTPYAVLGQTGNGWISLDATSTPRMSIFTQGANYNDQTEVARLGNIDGNWGYTGSAYGIALGEYASGKANLTYDQSSGLRLRIYDTDYIQLANDGDALITGKLQLKGASSALAIGATPPASASAGTGVWLDRTGLYTLVSDSQKAMVNQGGVRIAHNSDGLRFVAGSDITSNNDALDGRLHYDNIVSPNALILKAPGGYFNLDVGKAAFRANVGGAASFWKLISKGTTVPGDTNSNVQLAFGTIADNFVMLEHASGKPLLNVYLGSGSTPQRQFGIYLQGTNPTYVPLVRIVSLKVAASGGTGYIGDQNWGSGTYIQFAFAILHGWNDADGGTPVWCMGGLYKPASGANIIYFTNDNSLVKTTSGDHFVYLNSDGHLAIRNNSGSVYQYQGIAFTVQK